MKRQFILGTDWWTDCDDAVAVRLLLRSGIPILGIGINACMEYSVSSLREFIRREGYPVEIPIGIDHAAVDFEGIPVYQKRLALASPLPLANDTAPDAADLYCRLLTECSDTVEILEIGFPQVITEVIRRDPALFREKVSHVWMMAGKWDADGEKEHNFCNNARSRQAAHDFCEICPVPVTFLGFEAGHSVITGSHLSESDNLHELMIDHGSTNGRSSWDPMLSLLAVTGSAASAGYKRITGKASVEAGTGCNHFIPDAEGLHGYVIKEKSDVWYSEQIDNIIG